jgi:hypothetical protein
MTEKLTHWRKMNDQRFIGAYSLDPGKDLTLTIKDVKREEVTTEGNRKEMCIIVYFKEDAKPLILNSTNAKTISKLYKTPYIENWSGRAITLFATEVKAFGDTVEALRIRPNIPKTTVVITKCADCNGDIKGYDKFTAEQIAQGSYNKFGKFLCTPCAQKAKESTVEAVNPFETPQTEPTQPETETEPENKVAEEY